MLSTTSTIGSRKQTLRHPYTEGINEREDIFLDLAGNIIERFYRLSSVLIDLSDLKLPALPSDQRLAASWETLFYCWFMETSPALPHARWLNRDTVEFDPQSPFCADIINSVSFAEVKTEFYNFIRMMPAFASAGNSTFHFRFTGPGSGRPNYYSYVEWFLGSYTANITWQRNSNGTYAIETIITNTSSWYSGTRLPKTYSNYIRQKTGYDISNLVDSAPRGQTIRRKIPAELLSYADANGVYIPSLGGNFNQRFIIRTTLPAINTVTVLPGVPATSAQPGRAQDSTTFFIENTGYYQQEVYKMVPDVVTEAQRFLAADTALPSWRTHHKIVNAYADFITAVVAMNKNDIPVQLDNLLKETKAGFYHQADFSPADSNLAQVFIKLLNLNLVAEAEKLLEWYPVYREQFHDKKPTKEKFPAESILSDAITILSDAAAPVGLSSTEFTDVLLFTLNILEKKASVLISSSSPYSSIMIGWMKDLFERFQFPYQDILESAMLALGSGNGNNLLTTARQKLEMLPKKMPNDASIAITTLRPKRGSKTNTMINDDSFGDARRTVDVDPYKPGDVPSSQSFSSESITKIRFRQLNLLDRLFGFEKDDAGALTADTKQNAAAMKTIGTFNIHSNESWKKFLFKRFDLDRPTLSDIDLKTQSYSNLFSLLAEYYRNFTMHSDYNIPDNAANNVLNINYPRTLAGQLVHDCVVYALRTMYIFSSLSIDPDLKLKIYIQAMPLHVGTVITGNDLPVAFINNEELALVPNKKIEDLFTEWEDITTDRAIPAPKGITAREQLLAEIETFHYMVNVSMPYRIIASPALTGITAKDNKLLWDLFIKRVMGNLFSRDVLDPKSVHFQFHLKYLEVTEAYKNYYNKILVPLWNKNIYEAKNKMTSIASQLHGIRDIRYFMNTASLQLELASYENAKKVTFAEIENKLKAITVLKQEIDEHIQLNPDVIDSSSFVNNSERRKIVIDSDEIEPLKVKANDKAFLNFPNGDAANKPFEPIN